MEKTTLQDHEEKSQKNGIYPIFWKDEKTNMILMQDSPSTYFYVQVIGYELGAYEHHRGRKAFKFDLDLSFLTPSTSQEYQDMMKNYFAADKKLREKFIQKIYGNNQ